MTRLHKVLLAAAVLAVVVLLAVWQVPQWLDWTRYRGTIEALASATLGRPVSISGPISLTLLPEPVLTASQVSLDGGGALVPSIRVEALRLRLALWPLLSGRVDARELVLHGPDLRVPWPARAGIFRPPSWLGAFSARIENGHLAVGQIAFTGIDATLATLDTGALSASGTAQFAGQQWHFTARLTAAGADGAAGLNATLDGQGKANGVGAKFSGQVALDGTLAGTITSRGPNLAILLPAPSVPFRADGRLTIDNGLIAVDDLALEIGGSPASGEVALRIAPTQRLDLTLNAGRLDLDSWLPVMLNASGIEMPIGINVSAQAARLGGGLLEHVRVAIDLTGRDVVIRQASAVLPGNCGLQLTGRIDRDESAQLRFDGDARVGAPVLRTTLHWVEGALPDKLPQLPAGMWQHAALSAHVTAGARGIVLRQLVGKLDDAQVAGNLAYRRGEPPSLTAELSLDRLALDAWEPSRLLNPASLTSPMGGLDAELRLNVRHASLGTTPIDGLSVDAAIEAGNVQLRRAEGVARGMHFTVSGMLGGGKLTDAKLSAETKDVAGVADLLPLSWQTGSALWHGPASLDIRAGGTPQALAADLRLDLADAQLEASPTVDLVSGRWNAAVALQHPGARRLIGALGPPGLGGLPNWLGDGSLSLVAHLAGAPGRLSAEHFDLTAATLHTSGDLVLESRAGGPRVSGHIHADSITLPDPNVTSDVPLPVALLRGWQGDLALDIGELTGGSRLAMRDASARVSVSESKLTIDGFSAKLVSGAVSGGMSFDAASNPPSLAVQGGLNDVSVTGPLGAAPLDLLAGRVEGRLDVTASGFSPSAMLATLGGRAMLTVDDGTLSGLDLFRLKQAVQQSDPDKAQAAADDALQSGASGFDQLQLIGNVAHGDLGVVGNLRGSSGEAHISGDVNLVNNMLDVRITLQPALPSPPEIAVHLTGPADQPTRVPELAGLARWMAALVH